MDQDKKYTAKEVALAVLKKAGEMLTKSESLKKYATENSKKIGYKLSEEGKGEKPQERDWDAFEVKAGKAKVSDPRLAPQKAPQDDPSQIEREDLGGRLDSQVGRELTEKESTAHKKDYKKELASRFAKAETGHEKGVHTSAGLKNPGMSSARLSGKIAIDNKHADAHNTEKNAHKQVLGEMKAQPKPNLPKSEDMNKKYEGFKAVEESAKESGARDPAAVAAAEGRKKYGKAAFQAAAAKGKKMGKSEENPDEKQDAKLGEKLEAVVAQHMKENAPAERQEEKEHEGHASPEMKEEAAHEDAPQHRGHVKLAKFMGRMEHKRSLKKPEMDKDENVSRPDTGFGAIIHKGSK